MTTIRIVLFAILLLGMIGSGAELLLLSHTEDPRQWIPLILLGTGLLVCAWHGVYFSALSVRAKRLGCDLSGGASALSVRVLQTILLGYIFSGFVGMYFHYQGSAEFKLETNPSLSGWALFREAIRAKAPPLLAPGTMVQLGLLGLVYTYRHPALNRVTNKGA